VADRSVLVPMTVSDLERRDARGQIFRRIYLIYACTVWPITTKLGTITHGGRGVFLWVFHDPTARERVPALPNLGVPFYLCTHHILCCRTAKFDMVTHMGEGLVFRGQPRPRPKWRCPNAPQFWGFSCIYEYVVKEQLNWAWDTYGEGLVLGGQPRSPSQGGVALADPIYNNLNYQNSFWELP